ncbi:unnamed protein product [Kuraishia capsulata CBS 1993]|uniref:Zn(2)-C6 fungal-type domain-containing protein n=1 Tax=Kuraishia capsulata CBS 1993 TaxID=1382522 RepID=W6MW75_9ASCO|nr:uncharacterized protein KUCA_T00002947001 [Kuraishia capsulata CBS 1993]CDK26970.1 unnamed protein product [Kuraishia capsulata CBS 1993]
MLPLQDREGSKDLNVRFSKRAPRACENCSKRKVKCDKKIPCQTCVSRGLSHSCGREMVIVRNILLNYPGSKSLEEENMVLKQKLEKQKAEIFHLKRSLESLGRIPDIVEYLRPGVQNGTSESNSYHISKEVEAYDFEIQYVSRGLSSQASDVGHKGNSSDGIVSESSLIQSLQSIDKWQLDKLPEPVDRKTYMFYSTVWRAHKKRIYQFLRGISRETCFAIAEFSLKYLNSFHGAVIPQLFLKELDCFWQQNEHMNVFEDEYPEDDKFQGLIQQRLTWLSLLYSILANGFFLVPDEIMQRQGLSWELKREYGQLCFISGLECLQRTDYFECPSLNTLQAFGVMNTCFHAFGNVRLLHSLLDFVIMAARKLGLDELTRKKFDESKTMTLSDFELGKRLWWNLVSVDAFEEYGRVSSIRLNSFSTDIPARYPTFLLPPDPSQISELPEDRFDEVSYQLFIIKATKIRKMIFDSEVAGNQKERLIQADIELRKLLVTMEDVFRKNDSLHSPEDAYWLQKTLLLNHTCDHITLINKKLASWVPKSEWMRSHRDVCVKHSKQILSLFLEANLPGSFYNFWLFPHNVVTSSSFLVVDILININLQKEDERLLLVLQSITKLEKLNPPYNGLKKGIAMIKDLIGCIWSFSPGSYDKKVLFKGLTFSEIEHHLRTGELPERLMNDSGSETVKDAPFSLTSDQNVQVAEYFSNATNFSSCLFDFPELGTEENNEIASLLRNPKWDDSLNWLQQNKPV